MSKLTRGLRLTLAFPFRAIQMLGGALALAFLFVAFVGRLGVLFIEPGDQSGRNNP